ncbi:MAG: hypothetical protein IT349_20600 [Candidatus Eisenbacteria bacterium]|nr:hypothetical protein [Candidatus Eisenbacteria bacterium]
MIRYIPLRLAYALAFGVLFWALSRATCDVWFGSNPESLWVRTSATVVGVVMALYAFGVAANHVVDAPSAVVFPAKLGGALVLAILLVAAGARLFTAATGLTVFGHGAVLGVLALLVTGVATIVALDGFVAVLFESNLVWLAAPVGWAGTLVDRLVLAAKRFPSRAELKERFARLRRERRRRVEHHADESPVQTAAEARRRAERLL